jgi:TonB family protein
MLEEYSPQRHGGHGELRMLRCVAKTVVAGILLVCWSAASQDKAPAPTTADASIPDKPQGTKKYLSVGGKVHPPVGIDTREPGEEQAHSGQARSRGTVFLIMGINENGTVDWVRVERTLGKEFDDKAVAAVKAWTFQPATKDGVPVAVQINVEVNFKDY